MTFELTTSGVQLLIAVATSLAAFAALASVRLQHQAQAEDREQARQERRYQELVEVFDRAGEIMGVVYGRFKMYAETGAVDVRAALSEAGRAAHFAAIFRLHYPPEELPEAVADALEGFAKTLDQVTRRLPPAWWPWPSLWLKVRPVPAGLIQELLERIMEVQDAGRIELRKLTPRDDLPA